MKRTNEIVIGLYDLYLLRDGWTQTMMRLCSPDASVCEEDDEINVEMCLQKLKCVQHAIREAEALSDSMENSIVPASRTAN